MADKTVRELIVEIARSIEGWKDEATFRTHPNNLRFDHEGLPRSYAIKDINDIPMLISAHAFLSDRLNRQEYSTYILRVDPTPVFMYNGHSIRNWLHDVESRVDQLLDRDNSAVDLDSLLEKLLPVDSPARKQLENLRDHLGVLPLSTPDS